MQTISHLKIAQYDILPLEYSIQEKNQEKTNLQPKFIDVLLYLVAQYPRIVPRQELIDSVWDGNEYVGEKALTNAIWHLRKTLKSTEDNLEIIETIRKTGYRLLIKPQVMAHEKVKAPVLHGSDKNHRLFKGTIPYFVGLILISLFFWHYWDQHYSQQQINIETITTEPGRELFAAPSPNGRYVVYKWIDSSNNVDLYMRDLKQPDLKPIQLTFNDALEGQSVWSNDGQYLYFASKNLSENYCHIIRMKVFSRQQENITNCPTSTGYNYLDISPDNKTLAYLGNHDEDFDSGIYLLNLTDESAKPVRFSCTEDCGYQDRDIAFSPDGKKLAVTRRTHRFSENIYLVDLETKLSRQLTENEEDIIGVTWHPDGNKIVYGIQRADIRTGYLLDVVSGKTQPLKLEGFSYPTFTKSDPVLFYQQRMEKYQISTLALSDKIISSPFPILMSEFSHRNPDYSSVNGKITFVSNESGQYELWLANADGKNPEQLTHLNRTLRYPRWSHNGNKIAFLAPDDKLIGDTIYIFDLISKELSKLNTGYRFHNRPTWGIDDKTIISAIYNDNIVDLYQFDITTGTNKRITFDNARFGVMISPEELIYSTATGGLWLKSIDNNHASSKPIISPEVFTSRYTWAYTKKGIFYRQNIADHQQIIFYDFATNKSEPLINLPWKSFESFGALGYIPESEKLLFTVTNYPQADIKKLSHPLF